MQKEVDYMLKDIEYALLRTLNSEAAELAKTASEAFNTPVVPITVLQEDGDLESNLLTKGYDAGQLMFAMYPYGIHEV